MRTVDDVRKSQFKPLFRDCRTHCNYGRLIKVVPEEASEALVPNGCRVRSVLSLEVIFWRKPFLRLQRREPGTSPAASTR